MKCKVCGHDSNPSDHPKTNWAPITIGGGNRVTFETKEPANFGNDLRTKECVGELYVCLDCGTVRIKSWDLNISE